MLSQTYAIEGWKNPGKEFVQAEQGREEVRRVEVEQAAAQVWGEGEEEEEKEKP